MEYNSTIKSNQNIHKNENNVLNTIRNMIHENIIHEKSNVHVLSFRDPNGCPLYEQIIEKKKTVEGRKNSLINQKIKVGDILLLSDLSKGILECKVTYVNLYADVEEYLISESIDIVFGNPNSNSNSISNYVKYSIQEGCNIYHDFVDEKQIIDLKNKFGYGFIGIGIDFLHEYKYDFVK